MVVKPFYRHCLKCGYGFSTFEEPKVYCGDVCEFRDKAVKKRIDPEVTKRTRGSRQCPNCMVYFMPKSNQIYCHGYCLLEANQEKSRQATIIKNQNNPIHKICANCNEEFDTTKRNVKYCSQTCAQKMHKDSLEKLRIKRREENEKAGKKKRYLPYHVLNQMLEKKRLDEDWDRLVK